MAVDAVDEVNGAAPLKIRLVGLIPKSDIYPLTLVIGQDDQTGNLYVAECSRNFPHDIPRIIEWDLVKQIFPV